MHRRSEVALYREAGSNRQQLFPVNIDNRVKIIKYRVVSTTPHCFKRALKATRTTLRANLEQFKDVSPRRSWPDQEAQK